MPTPRGVALNQAGNTLECGRSPSLLMFNMRTRKKNAQCLGLRARVDVGQRPPEPWKLAVRGLVGCCTNLATSNGQGVVQPTTAKVEMLSLRHGGPRHTKEWRNKHKMKTTSPSRPTRRFGRLLQ